MVYTTKRDKQMTKTFADELNDAMEDSSSLTSGEKTYLGIGNAYDVSRYNPDTFEVEKQSLDHAPTAPHKISIRDAREIG